MVRIRAGERATTELHLDFGIRDVMQLGSDGQVYLVRFDCGCVVLVGHGRMIRRAGGIAVVCEHVTQA